MKIHSLLVQKIISFILLFSHCYLYSLERDYCYFAEVLEWGCNSNELCKSCFEMWSDTGFWLYWHPGEVDISVIPNLKKRQTFNWPRRKKCYCGQKTFYSGYLQFLHQDGFPFLNKQIAYTKKYPEIQSYWPETSTRAEKISDFAVRSLKQLFENTELKHVWNCQDPTNEDLCNIELREQFITSSIASDEYYYEDYPYKSLASSAFRFSDYYIIFERLIDYSKEFFSVSEVEKIEATVDKILDDLAVQFMDLYEESMALHPTVEILQEIIFVDSLYKQDEVQHNSPLSMKFIRHSRFGSTSESKKFKFNNLQKKSEILDTKAVSLSAESSCQPDWFMSQHLLLLGTLYNDMLLHKIAIESLNEAIRINPSEINAYIERAHAYFELDQLELAIEDYKSAKQLVKPQPPLKNSCDGVYNIETKGSLDYSSGFCIGCTKGGGISLVEFLPSTFSCCRGILHGLWSFACSPAEVSKDVINASYVLAEYLRTHTTQEKLEVIVPELKELLTHWDVLSDYQRGEQIGFIVGKYGVDILIPGTALRGVKKFRQFKRANTMFTLECCIASQEKKTKLLNQCAKHVSARQVVTNAVKSGKILPRHANVVPHVMQKKHAWEKVVKLTGNQQEDFIAVTRFLEENKILDVKNLAKESIVPRDTLTSPLRLLEYEAIVGSETIEAHFIKNLTTEETHLINAWVRTK